ncbi:HI1506-related protein [Cupriavidus gilardii]|uniref:HI1506-related protein n=1 Tax=Cupriavidus gilardii TaxID=82541 RepID=UPI00157172B2|nr:HI1506-related protein [Cupriavidus gilardii]NSX04808.1 hypothetical protein [Cupriavidus gilardii]
MMATKNVKVLRVVSRKHTFRRAGFEFGAEPKNIPLEQLSAAQLAAIKGDPSLVAVEAEVVIGEDGSVVDVPQATIDGAEARLRQWAAELNDRANDLDMRESEIKDREEAVAAAERAVADREAALVAKEAASGQTGTPAKARNGK